MRQQGQVRRRERHVFARYHKQQRPSLRPQLEHRVEEFNFRERRLFPPRSRINFSCASRNGGLLPNPRNEAFEEFHRETIPLMAAQRSNALHACMHMHKPPFSAGSCTSGPAKISLKTLLSPYQCQKLRSLRASDRKDSLRLHPANTSK